MLKEKFHSDCPKHFFLPPAKLSGTPMSYMDVYVYKCMCTCTNLCLFVRIFRCIRVCREIHSYMHARISHKEQRTRADLKDINDSILPRKMYILFSPLQERELLSHLSMFWTTLVECGGLAWMLRRD